LFGDQSFDTSVTEYVEKTSAGSDEGLKAKIGSGSYFFIQSGEGGKLDIKPLSGK
jgi:hypothetical protein